LIKLMKGSIIKKCTNNVFRLLVWEHEYFNKVTA